MRNTGVVLVCGVLCMLGSVAMGFTLDQVTVEQWVGTGDNEAVCVFNFGDENNYAFGYRWDNGDIFTRPASTFASWAGLTGDTALSEGMMLALDASTDLTVTSHYHNTFGYQLDSISYDGHTIDADWYTSFAGYWISGSDAWTEEIWGEAPPGSGNWQAIDTIEHAAAEGNGENWTPSGTGISFRTLSDGYWDAWTLELVTGGYSPVNTPMVPVSTSPGDANADGLVDRDDFDILKANFGQSGLWVRGDFNQDNIIDLDDFGILKINFSRGATVPEPTSMFLLIGGAVALIRRRRRG